MNSVYTKPKVPSEPSPEEMNTLVTLFAEGQYTETATTAKTMIEHFPLHGFGWKVLGAVFQQIGRNVDSLVPMQKAAALSPKDAEAHYNLGIILRDLGQLDAATAAYRRALEIKPNYAAAHNNLGVTLKEIGLVDEAIASYHHALEIKPDYAEAHHNLGVVLKDLGQFGPSLDSIRQAITLTLKSYRSLATPPQVKASDRCQSKKPMRVPEARATLDVIKARLDAASISWGLFAGTLLGVIRDGDVLPYDKDIDIALPCTVDRQWLIHLLTADGEFQLAARHGQGVQDLHFYDMFLVHTQHHTSVDLFFLHPDGQDHFLVGTDHPGQPILCRINRFDLGLQLWRDEYWPVPVQHELYFNNVYGDGWRQPDPYYDTVISNPCRIAESMPAVLCYGHHKLFSKLRDRDWLASKAYCDQLLARITDPLLSEVKQWLEQLVHNHEQHSHEHARCADSGSGPGHAPGVGPQTVAGVGR